MAKSTKVEEQKGPIRMDAQYTSKFMGSFQRTMEDMSNQDLRRSGQTLTLHTPKQ